MIELRVMTTRIESAARSLFGEAEAAAALTSLARYRDAGPTPDSPELLERISAAALQVSEGSLVRLDAALELAARDWRDLLMSAGFGYDLTAHEVWLGRFA